MPDRRLTPRGQARRAELMAYAIGRFAEQGYHTTSVAEIVEGLGVGKGVFYWYFDSKEELFRQILRDAQQDLRRRQQAAIADEPDPLVRIELGIRASLAWSAGHRDLIKLVQFAETETRFAEALHRGEEVAVADVVRHLKDAIVDGEIPDTDPEVLAHAVLGVTGKLARTFVHERSEPTAEVADAVVAFCLGGLSASPEPG
jgi:TetR/AcrR family transcriptional regulator, cholesterol catabolism regulator